MILPSRGGTCPPEYASKLKDYPITRFRLWDWEVHRYYSNLNTLVYYLHVPAPHLANELRMRNYLAMLWAYLKPMHPHSRMRVITYLSLLSKGRRSN